MSGRLTGYPVFLFVDVNITVKGIFGNTEIIRHLVAGFGDKESAGIVKELDGGHLVLFVHKSYRLAYQGDGFLDQMVEKIIYIVGDLSGLLLRVDRRYQRMQGVLHNGELGDVVVDAENVMQAAVVVADVGCAAFQDLSVGCLHQVSGVILKFLLPASLFIIVAYNVKNCVGRSVADAPVGDVAVLDIYDRVLGIVGFQIMDHNLAVRTELAGYVVRDLF